jgi:hypothetical protein
MLVLVLLALVVISVPLLIERKLSPQRSILTGLQRELSRYTAKGVSATRIVIEILVVDGFILLGSIPLLRWAQEHSLLWYSFTNAMVAVVLIMVAIYIYQRHTARDSRKQW